MLVSIIYIDSNNEILRSNEQQEKLARVVVRHI